MAIRARDGGARCERFGAPRLKGTTGPASPPDTAQRRRRARCSTAAVPRHSGSVSALYAVRRAPQGCRQQARSIATRECRHAAMPAAGGLQGLQSSTQRRNGPAPSAKASRLRQQRLDRPPYRRTGSDVAGLAIPACLSRRVFARLPRRRCALLRRATLHWPRGRHAAQRARALRCTCQRRRRLLRRSRSLRSRGAGAAAAACRACSASAAWVPPAVAPRQAHLPA